MSPPRTPHTPEFVTLEKYIDMRVGAICADIEKQSQMFNQRIEMVYKTMDRNTDVAKQAVDTADVANTRVLAVMNEFRSTINDMIKTLCTNAVFNSYKDNVDKDLRELREAKAKSEGKASVEDVNKLRAASMGGLAIGATGVILSIISMLLTTGK